MSIDLDSLLSPSDFLAWVGKPKTASGRRWLRRNVAAGKIPAVKMGRELRFHPRTVLKKTETK